MTYCFAGFFAHPPTDVRRPVREFWPSAMFRVFLPGPYHKPVTLPPDGLLGVTEPTRYTAAQCNRDEDEQARFDSLLKTLPSISRRFPSTGIAALFAMCHGGPVEAAGAVFRRGESLWTRSAEAEGYDQLITDCLSQIGAILVDGYFPPLERAAFDRLGTPFLENLSPAEGFK